MPVVGYFTAEIGLWSELHTYSGGLGVLAGDHVKSAADAGIPLVGVTLLYHQGYARQHIDSDGIQTETFPEFDPNKHLTKTDITITLSTRWPNTVGSCMESRHRRSIRSCCSCVFHRYASRWKYFRTSKSLLKTLWRRR